MIPAQGGFPRPVPFYTLAEDIEDAMEWGQDVWEVDARGLEMGDLVGEEHSFVKSDIPPNRIRLVVADGERL